MTAKDYLSELAEMRDDIEAKKELRQEYLEMAASISAPVNEIRVQTSHVGGGKMEKMTIMAADLAEEIEADVMNYNEHQHLIMKQIHTLHSVSYNQILFKVYVQFKSIKVASDEMKMSYQYVRNIHKKALVAFEEVHADMLAERETMEKFYDKEQPELVIAKSGEVRLYKTGKRLAVSKPSWSNSDGVHMGKTVSIDLAANEGNQELVQVLQNAIEILQTVKSTQA